MNRALRLVFLLPFLVVLLNAAGASGTWKGDFNFNGTTVPMTFNLTAAGEGLTGTVEGLPTSPTEVQDGKVDGDTISFWVITEYQGDTYKLVYKGKVSDDRIQFTFGTEDGSFGAEVTAKKSS
jgi:hypothetical protein